MRKADISERSAADLFLAESATVAVDKGDTGKPTSAESKLSATT